MMKAFKIYIALAFALSALLGCNGDENLLGGGSEGNGQEVAPEITYLDITGEYGANQYLTVQPQCADCVSYEYEWYVEDDLVSDSFQYLQQESDENKIIRLNVVGYSEQRFKSNVAQKSLQINRIEKLSTSYGSNNGVEIGNVYSYAGIKTDGSVVSWGSQNSGADNSCVESELVDVKSIHSNNFAFAALTESGRVVTWGAGACGQGGITTGGDSSAVKDELESGIENIYATDRAFVAITEDGELVFWGSDSYLDGSTDSFENIDNIITNSQDFLIIDENLNPKIVGRNAGLEDGIDFSLYDQFFSEETILYAKDSETDNVVVFTGASDDLNLPLYISNVKSVHSNGVSVAVIKNDGTVEAFGDPDLGGDISTVNSQLTNVVDIVNTNRSYAALTEDGTVVSWGDPGRGGDSTNVDFGSGATGLYAVVKGAFSATLKEDNVVAWGDDVVGGDMKGLEIASSEVVSIQSNVDAFAVVLEDKSVKAWGNDYWGGDTTQVDERLREVKAIENNAASFIAITSGHQYVTWGDSNIYLDSESKRSNIQPQWKTIYEQY